jgi:hypothetical protein
MWKAEFFRPTVQDATSQLNITKAALY